MKVRYFADTDTLLIEFRDVPVAETRDLDENTITSNTFTIEWPRHSGKELTFPEVDRGAWYSLADARKVINPAQVALLEELEDSIPREQTT